MTTKKAKPKNHETHSEMLYRLRQEAIELSKKHKDVKPVKYDLK
jgi:hypothetical protein